MRAQAAALLVFSAILVVISAAGILLETAYRSNSQLEGALCRFDICATDRLVDSARARRLELGPEAAALGSAESLEALRRDPASAARWCDAGEALLLSGQPDRAAYAFRRAVDLAPNSPPILLQAANFHFRAGRPADALPLTSRILHLIREYDPVIFLAWSRSALSVSDLLRLGIPADPAAARSFFQYTLASSAPQDAAVVWQFLRNHHYDTPPLAARYADFLLARQLYSDALAFWSPYAAPDSGYPTRNLLFNAGFEAPFSGARLDWTPSNSPHVSENRDSTVARSGNWSLRLDFDGAENIDYRGISQTVIVSPGPYRFRAWLKLDRLTTDRGLFFRILDPESPARLDLRTPAFTQAADWTPVELDLRVPPGTRLLQIQPSREPSLKFDNKISGTAWIDSVEFVRH